MIFLNMNADAGEPVVTMNLRDFNCSLALVGGGGIFCGRLKLWRVEFKYSNGGIIEVAGGGWGEIIELRRVRGGGGDTLEFGLAIIWFELEEESLVPLSSSNLYWLRWFLFNMNADAGEPDVTMNFRDFSCFLALVEGGGNCGRVKLWRVGFKYSNGGIIKVIGGSWGEII